MFDFEDLFKKIVKAIEVAHSALGSIYYAQNIIKIVMNWRKPSGKIDFKYMANQRLQSLDKLGNILDEISTACDNLSLLKQKQFIGYLKKLESVCLEVHKKRNELYVISENVENFSSSYNQEIGRLNKIGYAITQKIHRIDSPPESLSLLQHLAQFVRSYRFVYPVERLTDMLDGEEIVPPVLITSGSMERVSADFMRELFTHEHCDKELKMVFQVLIKPQDEVMTWRYYFMNLFANPITRCLYRSAPEMNQLLPEQKSVMQFFDCLELLVNYQVCTINQIISQLETGMRPMANNPRVSRLPENNLKHQPESSVLEIFMEYLRRFELSLQIKALYFDEKDVFFQKIKKILASLTLEKKYLAMRSPAFTSQLLVYMSNLMKDCLPERNTLCDLSNEEIKDRLNYCKSKLKRYLERDLQDARQQLEANGNYDFIRFSWSERAKQISMLTAGRHSLFNRLVKIFRGRFSHADLSMLATSGIYINAKQDNRALYYHCLGKYPATFWHLLKCGADVTAMSQQRHRILYGKSLLDYITKPFKAHSFTYQALHALMDEKALSQCFQEFSRATSRAPLMLMFTSPEYKDLLLKKQYNDELNLSVIYSPEQAYLTKHEETEIQKAQYLVENLKSNFMVYTATLKRYLPNQPGVVNKVCSGWNPTQEGDLRVFGQYLGAFKMLMKATSLSEGHYALVKLQSISSRRVALEKTSKEKIWCMREHKNINSSATELIQKFQFFKQSRHQKAVESHQNDMKRQNSRLNIDLDEDVIDEQRKTSNGWWSYIPKFC